MKPLSLLLALTGTALTGTALAQGPLTPPPGADPSIGPVNALTAGGLPQATMKTLHQVEPRTAIAGGSSTVTINQSGSYYLTGNIVVAASHGIEINASNVTLDLNGFSVGSGANPAEGAGINLSAVANVSISNGSIAGGFLVGVGPFNSMLTPRNVRVMNLSIDACPNWGVLLEPHANNRVEGCMVEGSIGGIRATLISDCSVTSGGITGRIVKGCSVTTSGTSGIVADVVENCYATSAGTAIQAKCLVNSYGTGGGNNDVISAGVAQNVWAEGGSGSGGGINAIVVANAHAERRNDLSGTATGVAITSNVVTNIDAASPGKVLVASVVANAKTLGGGSDDIVTTDIASNTWANAPTGGPYSAINASVVSSSWGQMYNYSGSNGRGIEAIVCFGSVGRGQQTGISVSSVAMASAGSGITYGIKGYKAVISGSSGESSFIGLHGENGLVSQSYGRSSGSYETGIISDLILGSYGVASFGTGMNGKLITNSYGTNEASSSGNIGINASKLVHTSFGQALTITPNPGANIPTNAGLLKFDSN